MYQRYKGKGVAFVGIFVGDTEANARAFVRTHRVSFPNGYDWKLAVAKPLGYRAMPYTVVISRQGEVAHRFHGPVSKADLITAIERLLTG
ncbi:MAG: TlpA family protein disulfide reductase [candidate division NC10 bacterium]|nr:TlpA family protein disulfide reductase [candidate division NC10 bacterium]